MRKDRVFVVLLLLICGLLYTSGLDYGRPLPEYNPSTVEYGWLNSATIFHPDAYFYASIPYAMLLRGISPVKPNFYENPSLTIDLNLVMSWLSNATSLYHGSIDPHAPPADNSELQCEVPAPPDSRCQRQITPFSVYVVARWVSVLMMLIAVSVVYTGGRLVFNRRVGLLAAALVGFSPMVVQFAHYENPGAPTLAVSSAALFMSLILMKRQSPSRKMYIAAGLLVGLSASARYNAGVVGVVLLVACIVNWRRNRQIAPPLIGLAVVPIGFLIATPGAIFEFRVFFENVRYILLYYGSRGGGPGWTTSGSLQSIGYYWRYVFLIVIGPLTSIATLFGLFRLLKRFRAKDFPFWMGVGLVAYMLVYTGFALSSIRLNPNLLIPMITPVALVGAYGFDSLPSLSVRWGRVILALVMLAWPVYLAVSAAGLFAREDNRMLAQDWIYQHVPRDTPVSLVGSYNVPLDPRDYPPTQAFGWAAADDDPLWNAPLIIYSDSYPHAVLRDLNLVQKPVDAQDAETTLQRLQKDWIEVARFPRVYWAGQDIPPDDTSLLHQMEIVIYCNPTTCPVKSN